MHIADIDKGMLGANAIVGGGPPIAVGAAIACKLRNQGRVAVAFGGDGSCNQGTVFEAMNLAVVLRVPAIFVFEHNGYSEHTGADYAVGSKDIAGRARAFGMPAEVCDGADFFAVHAAMGRALAHARAGQGPAAIEAKITRFFGHFEGDPQLYRTKEQIDALKERDALARFERQLAESGVLSEAQAADVWAACRAEVEEAIEFARGAPSPAPESALEHVFA
jgi:pyruvate dehydrogenase E1 component alpha subunit